MIFQVKAPFLGQGGLDHLGQAQLHQLGQILRRERLGQLIEELLDVCLQGISGLVIFHMH